MNDQSPARACGIDFGTSNSTVGWQRPGVESLIALEDDKITLPSVVFFNMEERRPVYGRLALHEYLEGYEGRLMRSLKSLLGSKLIKHDTSVLGTAMPFKDLLALFIGELKKRAEHFAGREFEHVVLGRPVHFVDDDAQADQEAEDTLAEVARKIGFKEVSFQFEPIAAAFDYESTVIAEELVLIVDIGGGTSDFSLVRLSPERREHDDRQQDILATGGVHIGGTDFDKQLSLQGVMPLFGYGSRMKSGAYMPTSHHINLATWHTINAVYSQKSQLALGSMRYDIEDTGGIDRLFKLIEQRAGHWLAMEVEETKIHLTHAEHRHLPMDRVEPGLSVELSRAMFEAAIDAQLERVRNSVTNLLNDAGVGVEQVNTVFFTGGSSGIPALRNSVSAMLPNARHVEGNIFGSIGSGLAIEAKKRYG
ncbi:MULTISPECIES: Hsp70 family protein [Pseudomonas syringae group]|uniref:HSP70 protein n=2 Tax=Pseudomonas syringae group TaxID=136849 RepID=A0AB37QPE9_9PSED|nr:MULTISPECIES: Hsp70 family protein [Pseudomonas syringae group]KPX34945.1 HSP70 family protein [Pseudomonas coronafaciens pv. garcae]KPZ28919.1 HSP70 family protein [Pseudomonas coronafaciens pv. zizaniae]MCQ3017660.1 Hsp70 family protein [Pseudomonas tremae]QGL55343.1 Hsp70 family protein [Pseudomonas coronafaciens pv. oryzae str. 1_6]RMM34321.1 HSP70 protein [Pseudomonas coronafaciens pv. oryzae]